MKTISTYTLFVLFITLTFAVILNISAKPNNQLQSIQLNASATKKFNDYKSLSGYKAFAVAIDNKKRWAYGYSSEKKDQKGSISIAMSFCNKWKKTYKVTTPCMLYAQGNNILKYPKAKVSFSAAKQLDKYSPVSSADRIDMAKTFDLTKLFKLFEFKQFKEILSNENSLTLILIVLSSVWVYIDTTNNKIGKIPGKEGFTNLSAGAWAISVLLLWVIAFPVYLINRENLIDRAKQMPIEVTARTFKIILLLMVGLFWLAILTQSRLLVFLQDTISSTALQQTLQTYWQYILNYL